MFDRLVETFCDFDDFCKSIKPHELAPVSLDTQLSEGTEEGRA